MVFGGIQAFNLVSILLFLLPGLIGVKVYLQQVNSQDRFNRIDTVALSFVVSLLGLLLIYLWYWVSLPPRGDILLGHAPRIDELESHLDSLPELVWHYSVVLCLTVAGGLLLGHYGGLLGYLPDAPNKIWRTKFEAAVKGNDDNYVQVVTTDGERIEGKIDEWSANSRNVVLQNPKRVTPDGTTQNEVSDDPQRKVYLHDQDLSRIYFEEPSSADEASVPDPETTGETTDRETEELEKSAEMDSEDSAVVANAESTKIEDDHSEEN